MKKKTLRRDIRKCFAKSKGRFFSIMCLIALGSFALVGLQIAGPDMRKTGENYFSELKLSDISVIGDYGIDEENQKAIERVSGASNIEYDYLKDVVINGTDTGIRIFSKTDDISTYEVIEGRLPETETEIALASFFNSDYSIGDTVEFDEKADISGKTALKNHKFTIVGFVNSSELLSIINMGQSTAGTGELKGYAVVADDAFDYDVYMIARISFADTKNIDPYSDEYTTLIGKHKKELETLLADQPKTRLSTIKSEYSKKIDEAQNEVDKGKKELSDALCKLENGESELNDAKQKYADGQKQYNTKKADADKQLSDAENKLNSASAQIANGEKEINEKKSELSQAEQSLKSARAELDNGWKAYNQKFAQFSKLKKSGEELSKAETELNAKISKAEDSSGMTITDIEANLPEMKTKIENSEKQYESLCALAALKKQTETAIGTDNYNTLYAQYQAALQAAGLTEETADASFMQLDNMKTQINEANTQYQQLCSLIQVKHEFENKQAEYQKTVKDSKGSEQQLSQAKKALDSGEKEYSENKAKFQNASIQLSQAEERLNQAKSEYQDGVKEYNLKKSEAEQKLTEARKELEKAASDIKNGEKELADGRAEYNKKKPDAEKKISDAEEEISKARKKLEDLKAPVYAVDTRREVPGSEGYRIYSSVSNIIDSLADIFPIFLYFVAALVTLTTMTRFVDEERINSGTLKALGYSNRDIIRKFTVYGLLASTIGAIIGITAGHLLLPMIVYNAYGKSFTYPQIELHFYPLITVAALVLALLCTVVPAFIVANNELKEKPSALLQPKPPQAGSKILLERISPIWKRMNFTHKVTARNIFRYKKRMLMTIFGVCGSVTLIFAGFSVQHSISGINDRQFENIICYDMIVAESDNADNQQKTEINDLLNSDIIEKYMPIYYEEVTKTAGKNNDKQEIKLIVPENSETFRDYINLTERTTEKSISLTNDGCVISERLSTLLNVKKGDSITVTDSENNEHELIVSDITEMYTGHFIFADSSYYRKAFASDYSPNASLVTLKDHSSENTNRLSSVFMKLDGVKGVVQNTTMKNQINTIVTSLNKIMQILILVAIMLAAVILYNLTNINVSERIRELSTIKVLGFYNKEVTMYIYRETIILTLLGIITGYGFGDLLFLYIISVVPPDEVMFSPALGAKAFVIPFIVVSLITLMLGIFINRKLKKVDMLEALKSVE